MKELTDAVEKMNPNQIQDLETIVETPQKKTGFWKKVGIGALGVLGLYTAGQTVMPTKSYAENRPVTIQGMNQNPVQATIVGNRVYVNEKAVGEVQGNQVIQIKGVDYPGNVKVTPNTVIHEVSPQTPQRRYDDTPSYASEIEHAVYFKQAEELLDKKMYSEALDHYKKAIASAKKCNIDNKTLANYYIRMHHPFRLMNNIVSAEKCVKEAIKLDPYKSGYYNALAGLPSKSLSQKIKILEKGYKIAGSINSTLLTNLGAYYLISGKRNLAMKAFEDSYRINDASWNDNITPSKWFEYYDKQKDKMRDRIEKDAKK